MKLILTHHDIHPDYAGEGDEIMDEDGKVQIHCFSIRAITLAKVADRVEYRAPNDKTFEVSGIDQDTEAAVLTVKIKPEDRQAGVVAVYRALTYKPDLMDPLNDEDMVQYVLMPATRTMLARNRDRMKWFTDKLSEHLPKTHVGRTMTKVTDASGKEHHVMLPNGKMWQPLVTSPREGTWKCEKSPTDLCWYDEREDPSWDGCLFCGFPHERK